MKIGGIVIPGFIFSGVSARLLMSGMPNIEPVMLVTILAALKYGPKYGFITGFFTMLISDFYLGLPGPWTLYTAPSFGFVGLLAGIVGVKKQFTLKYDKAKLASMAGGLTLIYDILTNIGWALNWGLPIFPTLIFGIPFSGVHILSNMLIVGITAPYLMYAFDIIPSKIKEYTSQPLEHKLRM